MREPLRSGQSDGKRPVDAGSVLSRNWKKAITAGAEHGDGDEVGKVSGRIIHGLVSGFMKLACILRAMGSHGRFSEGECGRGLELDSALWWLCEDWRPQCSRPGLVLSLCLSPCPQAVEMQSF